MKILRTLLITAFIHACFCSMFLYAACAEHMAGPAHLVKYLHSRSCPGGKRDYGVRDHRVRFFGIRNYRGKPACAEILRPRIIAAAVDFYTQIGELIREDNGNTQTLEIVVDRENPRKRAVSWQWQSGNSLSFGWEKSLKRVDVSGEDLADLIVRCVVSGTAGSDFLLILEDNAEVEQINDVWVGRRITIPVSDYVSITGDLQSLAVPLDVLAAENPDFNWSHIKKIGCRPVSAQGTVLIQSLDIEDVGCVRGRGMGTMVFQDNAFTPIDDWCGIKPAFIMSFKDLLDIAAGDLAEQFQLLAEHDQLPYLTLEFWQMESDIPEEREVKKERFIARYGQSAYETLLSQIDNECIFTSINEGDMDFIIRDYAAAIAGFGRPVLFRPFHEFNGGWYPWSIDGGKEDDFIAAWRRIHDIFRQERARNAVFVFSPYVLNRKGYDPVERILAQIKDTVDIIAFDGYGPNSENPNGPGFNGLFTELSCRFQPYNLPLMIGEFGSESKKASFYQSMDQELRSGAFPQLIGITHFDIIKLERGVLRDFGVSTIPEIIQGMQEDGFYSTSTGHLLRYIGAYGRLPHYYWGGVLPRAINTVVVPAVAPEPEKQVTVLVTDTGLLLDIRTLRNKNRQKFRLDLISGKLTAADASLSPVVDAQAYLGNIKIMNTAITEAADFAQKKSSRRALLAEANYLNGIVYRMENPDTSDVVMPVLPAAAGTDLKGKVKIEFVSGTLFSAQLNELWAEVQYDDKTEYWFLHPGMLAADGLSFSMRFDPSLNNKTLEMKLYGIDTQDRQTLPTNVVTVQVTSEPSDIVMPVLPDSVSTDAVGRVTVNFMSGVLLPSQLSELWAEVKYDGKIEYWQLHPSMLSAAGTTFSMRLEPSFSGKLLEMRLYGIDTQDRQTSFTNTVAIHADFQPSPIVMPVLPSVVDTDLSRLAHIVFSYGTLFPSQLLELWGEVAYDGRTEYWFLHPSMLDEIEGKFLDFQFEASFSGKALTIRFYGFDTSGRQTFFTNPVTIHVQ